jgi:LysR family transcriptional regulator, glycine cleavage system transcriptional activator
MPRRLPPLNGLRAFEAAARHMSFSKAAEELNVTPAAISQQVKGLEAYYDVPLFRRATRTLYLTDAGQAALPTLREGFDKLAEAANRIAARESDSVLTVSVTPSFAAKWLMPRLEHFVSAHPEFDVRLDATEALTDFDADNVDAAIRYGLGSYDNLYSMGLMEDEAFPVCSPALLKGPRPLSSPEDLRYHSLLHVDWKVQTELYPNWSMWLKAAGVQETVNIKRGPRFSSESLSVQAAVEGLGVAITLRSLARDDLKAGRLVRPFARSVIDETKFFYHFVCPYPNLEVAKVKAFKDWIMLEAQELDTA